MDSKVSVRHSNLHLKEKPETLGPPRVRALILKYNFVLKL